MMNEPEMPLCRECYKRMLSIQMAIPIWQVEKMLEKALGVQLDPEPRRFRFTPDHAKCGNCPVELKRLGHDPCVELLIFDYDIESLRPGKNLFLRLFSALVGYDAVTENGNYLAMVESWFKKWQDEVDPE